MPTTKTEIPDSRFLQYSTQLFLTKAVFMTPFPMKNFAIIRKKCQFRPITLQRKPLSMIGHNTMIKLKTWMHGLAKSCGNWKKADWQKVQLFFTTATTAVCCPEVKGMSMKREQECRLSFVFRKNLGTCSRQKRQAPKLTG